MAGWISPTYRRIFGLYTQANYIAISDSQRTYLPELNWVRTVYHGVDVDRFPYSATRASISPLSAASRPRRDPSAPFASPDASGIPLKIAAKVDPNDQVVL